MVRTKEHMLELIKNRDKIKDFVFKDMTVSEFIALLDKKYPITARNSKYIQDLAERVCYKYPLVSKADVIIVVAGFFGALRCALISNKIISSSAFLNAKMKIYKHFRKQKTEFFIYSKILVDMDGEMKKHARS